ncbi:uncharacterized protein SPPG_08266 [Spizellomyces punctatus DAOM BR117]|uniref:FAD/NAD(P)-binding domain-containing protein n=1 Tax=Spizellomyces punctatus (strain DAOM BR117) TaxID=645134 RepID=A0A0L0H625_SPIPD|nr:uncharacterized protein SPPG_08266 [Spizellomyces punctatus DAOM BR117]KNC96366.1 hypothetical protein SPPG_08266 [Spizellomyces punctatus DAOM BR117]|eukprot:XP_016604406.1 hypothetical protein SPPG_08266 [Spizellomyces punctatus DAOM BR117]
MTFLHIRLTLASIATTIISLFVWINLFLATGVSRLLAWAANQGWYPWLPSKSTKPQSARPRVAIIGAGVTGVSAGAACIRSSVECTIYEKGDQVGGVWARVNKTSALQFQALFYRFHPAVRFRTQFPSRDEILVELRRIWEMYDLPSRTRFNTPVTSVTYDAITQTYTVNGTDEYDAVISAVGTCGDILIPPFKGLDDFAGLKAHSSQMDKVDLDLNRGKRIVVVGSGASAVEVIDYVLQKLDGDETKLGSGEGMVEVTVIARHDKWIMPRGVLLSSIASMLPAQLGFLFEIFLRRFWYGSELHGMTPKRPFYASTPCLNTRYLDLIRNNKIRYIRGKLDTFTSTGVKVTGVAWDSQTMISRPAVFPEEGGTADVEADTVFFATGFKHPDSGFVDDEIWKGPQGGEFRPPNLFCVAFPPKYPTMLFLNDAYVDAVATAGHIHIGVLTRLLLTFLLDPATRPTPMEAATWVTKRKAKSSVDAKSRKWVGEEGVKSRLWGGYNRWEETGLAFYSYGELLYWVASTVFSRTSRWKYAMYIAGWNHSKVGKLARSFGDRADGKHGVDVNGDIGARKSDIAVGR